MKFTSALIALSMASAVTGQTVVDIAVGSEAHTTLVQLVTDAGLVETLSGEGPFTVFAPTNDAFAALPETAAKYTTPEWHAHRTDILTYHVVAGEVMSTDLVVDAPITMVNGGTASITTLEPPTINDAVISGPDLDATNGVVHVVDSVLLPTSVTSSIVDIATSEAVADTFGTLVAAVQAGDLVETLGGEGPFTVFAPTNEAFAKIDQATLDTLLSPEGKDQLIDILTYHVFPGIVYASDLADGDITMVNGDSATIDAKKAMINDAKIVGDQVLASNGVIHAIDTVIMPPSDGDAPAPAPAGGDAPAPEPAPAGGDAPAPEGGEPPLPVPGTSGAFSMGSMVALATTAVAFMLF